MITHQVRALLMGGQACVFYGAAEFSRDTDLVVLADAANWDRLLAALSELKAECIAVPPAQLDYLLRGFAIHFRCHHPEAAGMRVDIMSKLRGVDEFEQLWMRRVEIEDDSGGHYQLISLPDLVKAKKTQRSKDWPMIRRLVEADYAQGRKNPNDVRVDFWLRELRSPATLVEVGTSNPELVRKTVKERPLLALITAKELASLETALEAEEKAEREKDRLYWLPLKAELEKLRHPPSS